MTAVNRSPLMLYVHIPFCVHKCHYCDFNSHERANPDWQNYQLALGSELRHWSETAHFADRKLTSIFIGGGTPSLAPAELIEEILLEAERLFGFEEGIEITLEANPGTVDAAHFRDFRMAGVNRLSMGVQSLNDRELKWLERIHDSKQAIGAFEIARKAGFSNINLDLIYGLPGQSIGQWLDSLATAIDLGTEHLSCYQLTVEPHTLLAKTHATTPLPLPDDDLALAMFHETRTLLAKHSFNAYEISNFSLPGFQCRHNDGYWKYYDYIGIGAGASGKWDEINDSVPSGIVRYSNIRSPERYISAAASATAINSQETLDIKQAAAEAVWLGLRRASGIDRARFGARFGFDVWDAFSDQLKGWRNNGMLDLTDNALFLTQKGLTLADAISESVL